MITDHAGWTGYHISDQRRPSAATAPAREVLVALDGSWYAERSLEVADALAAAAGLPLRLVALRATSTELSSTENYLSRVARRAPRVSGVTAEITPDVSASLAEAAEAGALVVMATHARHAVGEALFGSVADQVLQGTTRSILLVGPEAGVPDPTFATMLLPDDGGPGARGLRPVAQAWSEHLTSVPWVVQVLPATGPDPTLDVLEAAHVRGVATAMTPHAEWEVLHGADPAEEIVAFAADRRAALIAMSVPPRHRVALDAAGGVAVGVVRHAPCPVLAFGRVDP
jgi:nucleotide-binding universal stress UspA family protein